VIENPLLRQANNLSGLSQQAAATGNACLSIRMKMTYGWWIDSHQNISCYRLGKKGQLTMRLRSA